LTGSPGPSRHAVVSPQIEQLPDSLKPVTMRPCSPSGLATIMSDNLSVAAMTDYLENLFYLKMSYLRTHNCTLQSLPTSRLNEKLVGSSHHKYAKTYGVLYQRCRRRDRSKADQMSVQRSFSGGTQGDRGDSHKTLDRLVSKPWSIVRMGRFMTFLLQSRRIR